MEGKNSIGRRTNSLSLDNQSYSIISAKHREITNAIHNRKTSTLLRTSFARTSLSPIRPTEDKSDSSMHLMLLKRTIDHQKLSIGQGDNTITALKQELYQLELEETKRDFWTKQNHAKIKSLQNLIEEAIKNQLQETNNQEIYNHLLIRMKKTKIFLELRSAALNEGLENSESVLAAEKKKQFLSQEAALQAVNAFKDFKKSILVEKEDGSTQIYELQKSIEKSKLVSDRRDTWKKHQETMYEVAVIEDHSAKNLKLKEGLSLHKLWYNILTKIYERKKEKSKQLEEAFQNIKILTGIPDISSVVQNFLTKEQTYVALMQTVTNKETECSNYKKKIDEMQACVDNFAHKDIGNEAHFNKIKEMQEIKIKELFELSQKKFLIENTYSKVKTWIKLMIRKFNKILGKQYGETSDMEKLIFYIQEIRQICNLGIEIKNNKNDKGQKFGKLLGLRVEDNRKYAVNSMIRDISRVHHTVKIEEALYENELIGVEAENEEKRWSS